jgi:outer membrane protein assembly complex protein YaeT
VKPEVRLDPTPQANTPSPVSVRFLVAEGPQTVVGTVAIEGASVLPEPTVRALLTLTTGKPFYRPQLDADHAAIERLYRNEGFQTARVSPESTLAADGLRIDIRWVVREGARTTVDHVLVAGNVNTSADLIRREIVLRPGEPLGEDAVVESQRRLAALGLFRRVRIVEVPHGVSRSHDVLVEVEEAPATSISEGGGIEAIRRLRPSAGGRAEARFEVAPRGFFEITRRNLWGKNRSLSMFTRVSFRPRDPAVDSTDPADAGGYGFNEYRLVGTLREPRPFDQPGEAQLTGFFEQAVRSSFNFSRRGARAEYARRFATALTVSGRYTFDYTKLFDEKILADDRLLVDRLFPQVRLSTFTGSALRDSRNDVLDPERGTVLGIDGSVAPRFAGSEVGFARTFLQAAVYRRLPGGSRFVIAAASRVGLAVGFARRVERVDDSNQPVLGADGEPIVDVVKDLPASERFFAGGDTTVRGFVLDQLGADDTLNDQGFPTGGNALIVLNLEVRAPYWKGLGAVVFLDAGNVFKRVSDLNVADLRPAAGFGLRYRSPLGPLRVDLGFNLNRQVLRSGAPERGSVFHISLGQAF